MAAATVSISESNAGTPGSPSVTASITGTHMGTADTVNLVAGTANAITAGSRSMEKWQRFNVSANASSNTIKNFKVWASAALTGSDVHYTNVSTSAVAAETYNPPSVSDRSATYHYTQTMPVTEPASCNIGVAADLTAAISTTGYSDYVIMQILVNAATVAGKTVTMYYQYDEYA